MMATQAFLYNAIFFSYALVLVNFYHVASDQTGYYFLAFAAGNLAGPLIIGPLFDTVGRRKMIALTCSVSALLLRWAALRQHRQGVPATQGQQKRLTVRGTK